MTEEQRANALQAIEAFSQPMEVPAIVQLIARLSVISPEREKSQVDVKARTAIWIEELSRYPADVVKKALTSRFRWFPSLAEVLEICDNEIAYRKLIERGIRCYRTSTDI